MSKAPLEQTGWYHIYDLGVRQFRCGFCDQSVASNKGWDTNHHEVVCLRVCPLCSRPTYFELSEQQPGVSFGSPVDELPVDIGTLYSESRVCCSTGSYNGAVLLLRKLLMNIAVNLKAPEGKPFITYVEYLADNGYVPPNGKGWVDHIRKKGNEANHEITLMNKADAEELIVFSEMLLKFIYEFPKRVPQSSQA